MKKIVRLTESDLTRIVKRVINEMEDSANPPMYTGYDVFIKLINGSGTSQTKIQKIISACNTSNFPSNTYTNKIADMIYDAISEKTLGIYPSTDEGTVYEAMKMPRTIDEFCGVVKSYKDSYDQDLYDALDGDFDLESEWVQIMRPLRDLGVKSQQSMKVKNTPKTPTKTNATGSGPTRPMPNFNKF